MINQGSSWAKDTFVRFFQKFGKIKRIHIKSTKDEVQMKNGGYRLPLGSTYQLLAGYQCDRQGQ